MNSIWNPKNDPIRLNAISDQRFSRYGSTVYVFECFTTAAFGVKGETLVMANSKLPKAERTAPIKSLLTRYNISTGDPEDPIVRVYGAEYVNRVTGVRRFVETHREELPERHTYEEMKRDPRYKRMGRI